MAGKPTPQEKIDEAVRLYSEHKSTLKVGRIMGCSDSTVDRYLARANVEKNGHLKTSVPATEPTPLPILPEFPEEDISEEEIVAHMARRFEKRKASHDAHTWFPIKIRDPKPTGLFWFGDPHLDDNGCNWTVLQRDIDLCKNTEGLYGVNIGDTTNNWAGRLVKLYANQDTSVKTARRLAEWFLMKSGVSWLVILLGNHDVWGDGAEIIAQMVKRHGTHKVICHDWEARFCLSFANGWAPRIYAAHDFPGHSQWNPLHGPMKAGQMGDDAELFVCGHKHNAAMFEFENAARGKFQRFVRVRGYKFLDDYARRLGITEQSTGCSAVTVFDPEKRKITVFSDVEEGAAYLAFKRARA